MENLKNIVDVMDKVYKKDKMENRNKVFKVTNELKKILKELGYGRYIDKKYINRNTVFGRTFRLLIGSYHKDEHEKFFKYLYLYNKIKNLMKFRKI